MLAAESSLVPQDEDIVIQTFNLPVDIPAAGLAAAIAAQDTATVHLERVQQDGSAAGPAGSPAAEAVAALGAWVRLRKHFLQVLLPCLLGPSPPTCRCCAALRCCLCVLLLSHADGSLLARA